MAGDELLQCGRAEVRDGSIAVNSLYDYNQTRAQLDRAIGRFAYVGNGAGYPSAPPAKVVGRP